VASIVASLFLEDQAMVLVEPRMKNPNVRKGLALVAILEVRLVYTAPPEVVALIREAKADIPVLNALARTGPGRRTNIEERPLACVLPAVLCVLRTTHLALEAKMARWAPLLAMRMELIDEPDSLVATSRKAGSLYASLYAWPDVPA
jgi:hypothetical protein